MSKTTKSTKSIKSTKSTKFIKVPNTSDQIPTKLLDLFKNLNLPITTDRYSKCKFITLTDKIKESIPFDILSDSFRVSEARKNTQTNKINIIEMINTMLSKKKIASTTKPNVYKLIPFFEAVGKLCVDEETFEVYNDRGLFRPEDKFTYRLVENLNSIFPGIVNKIISQKQVPTIRRTFIVDICIEISDCNVIGIEFDEAHHFGRDKEVSDNLKRNLISRLLELRIYKYGIDDFDKFLKALYYDIIKYHDLPDLRDLKLDYVSSFISYNINKMDNTEISPDSIKHYVSAIGNTMADTIDVDVISDILLNSDIDNVKKSIKTHLKSGFIFKNKVLYDDDDEISSLYKSELLKFLMLYDDISCNPTRILFARIIQEYVEILNGSYDIYKYACSGDQFITDMEEEVLAYSMTPCSTTKKPLRSVKTINIVNNVVNAPRSKKIIEDHSSFDDSDDMSENISDQRLAVPNESTMSLKKVADSFGSFSNVNVIKNSSSKPKINKTTKVLKNTKKPITVPKTNIKPKIKTEIIVDSSNNSNSESNATVSSDSNSVTEEEIDYI